MYVSREIAMSHDQGVMTAEGSLDVILDYQPLPFYLSYRDNYHLFCLLVCLFK